MAVGGAADGVGETRVMGGERARLAIPTAGGEVEIAVKEGGEEETVVKEGGVTAVAEDGVTVVAEDGVTAAVEGGVTAVVEDGETAVVKDGETAVAEGGEQTKVAEDGEAEGVGVLLVPALVRVVVDGAPPARRAIPLMQLNLSRRRPSPSILRFKPHQITPGVHRLPRGARLVWIPRPTLGVPQTKPHGMNLRAAPVPKKGRERARKAAFRAVVGRVGAKRRTPKLPLARSRPEEEAGGRPARLSPRPPPSPKVAISNLIYLVPFSFYYHHTQNGILTRNRLWPYSFLGSTPATSRLDTAPVAMSVDEGEPHFEGKAILTALENIVRKRRNKRKRSHEDIRLSPRYYRHLIALQRSAGSEVDGDGDAVMGGTTDKSARDDSLEAGEITEPPPCTNYNMNVLSRVPRTSEEKTTYAEHLLQ